MPIKLYLHYTASQIYLLRLSLPPLMHSHGLKYQYITNCYISTLMPYDCVSSRLLDVSSRKAPLNMMTLLITYWAISILHKLSHLILWYSEYTLYPLLCTTSPIHQIETLPLSLSTSGSSKAFSGLCTDPQVSGAWNLGVTLESSHCPTLNAAKSTFRTFPISFLYAFYLPFTPLLKPPSPLT